MATALAQPAYDSYGLRRKRFRREEVNHMLDLGLFEGQRFELIDGDLIDKMGQGPKHFNTIQRVVSALLRVFVYGQLRVQGPIQAGGPDREWSQPEPDIAVVTDAKAEFKDRHPFGHELALAIEVADTSFRKDSTRKREIYAAAQVPEYWVLDLESRRLMICRDLRDGDYRETRLLGETETVAMLGVTVGEMLG